MNPRDLLLLCMLLIACEDPRPQIALDLSGLSADVRVLEITLTPEGMSPLPTRTVSGDLEHLVLWPPAEMRGRLQMRVVGLSVDGCLLAEGVTTVRVRAPVRYRVRVTLTAVAVAGCRLRLVKLGNGEGSIVNDAGQVLCTGSCELSLPPEKTVRLRARAGAGAYFGGWAGACTGAGECVVVGQRQGQRVYPAFVKRQPCTREGWCLVNPTTSASTLFGVWGAGFEAVL